jgi:hypothetical protein
MRRDDLKPKNTKAIRYHGRLLHCSSFHCSSKLVFSVFIRGWSSYFRLLGVCNSDPRGAAVCSNEASGGSPRGQKKGGVLVGIFLGYKKPMMKPSITLHFSCDAFVLF